MQSAPGLAADALISESAKQSYAALTGGTYLQGGMTSGSLEPIEPTGTLPIIVLHVEFTDQPALDTDESIASRFFSGDESITAFYTENSDGKFTFAPAAETCGAQDGVIHLYMDREHPKDKGKYLPALPEMVRQAMIDAGEYIDYAAYDKNGDGKIAENELAIYFVTAGYEQSIGTEKDNAVWAHRWNLSGAKEYISGYNEDPPVVGGVTLDFYAMTGEVYDLEYFDEEGTWPTEIAAACHELGHVIGLPDLYNTDKENDTEIRVGGASLMAGGSWGKYEGADSFEFSPVHLDAWSKVRLGFYTPEVVSEDGVYDAVQSADPGSYKIFRVNTSDPDEYYLIENRQLEGFDAALFGLYGEDAQIGGVIVWHVDDGIVDKYNYANQVNNYGHDPGVMPVMANNDDPFRTSAHNARLSYDTTPATNRYSDGYCERIAIDVKDENAAVMKVDVSIEGPLSQPLLAAENLSPTYIQLDWEESNHASEYVVMRRVYGKKAWERLCTTQRLSFTDGSAETGVYYQYCVCAVDKVTNERAVSNIPLICARPATPFWISAEHNNNDKTVVLRWGASAGDVQYRLVRFEPGKGWRGVALTDGCYFRDTVKKGVQYYYRVQAYTTTEAGKNVFSYFSGRVDMKI